MSLNFLIVASETPSERETRRQSAGASSDESYATTLQAVVPGCLTQTVSCVDEAGAERTVDLAAFDAIFFSGSPIQMHSKKSETQWAVAFMRAAFASQVPIFGSCAGMQIASVAAGGTSKPRQPRMEAAFVRRITRTREGEHHPLLRGRPASWDAPAMHSDEVCDLPQGGVVLAGTSTTPVQAIEIRHNGGIFWGVQYHPELSLAEIAQSLRRQKDDLVAEGLIGEEADLEAYASKVEALGQDPKRRDLAWQLGVDEEITDANRRMRELQNFIDHLVRRKEPATDRPEAA